MKKWRNSIQSKITLGYGIIILSVFVSFIAVNFQLQKLQSERITIVDQGLKIQMLTNRMEQSVYEMEISQHASFITDEKKYMNTYDRALRQWQETYNILNPLLNKRPEQLKQLLAIQQNLDLWIMRMKEHMKEPVIGDHMHRSIEEERMKEMTALHNQFENFRLVENLTMEQEAELLNEQNAKLSSFLFIAIFGVSMLAFLLAKIVSSAITSTLNHVTQTIQKLAISQGEFEERIAISSNDEVKDLAIATNHLLDNMEQREWLQSHLNTVVSAYQGVTSIMSLAEIFLAEISVVIGASHGVFYVRSDEQFFHKKASFADGQDSFGCASFKVGEGLIGQVVKSRKLYKSDEMTKNHPFFTTDLDERQLTTLLIVPILHDGKVIAVAEFATMKEFSPIGQELLMHVMTTFGLTIDSVMRRREIVKLLNESRRLTMELQVKSEKMREQSMELRVKSLELTEMNIKLEARTLDAEAKSRELELAKQDVELKSREILQSAQYKAEFLANISHELRTPLNSILLLSEMMKENADVTISAEEVEFATIIHSSGQDLLWLINDILDLSKIGAGKVHIEFSEVNINAMPELLNLAFHHHAKKGELEFTIVIEEDVPTVFCTDEMRLHQIVKNLLSNAFKFTEKGAIRVMIRKVKALSAEMAETSDTWLAIEVEDTGIGIPIEKQDLIFESFQQADGATVRKYGGTGLGLAICKEFTKLLGGFIKLHSEVGKGSCFTVVLPSAKNDSVHMVEESIHSKDYAIEFEADFDTKRVLIVGDNYQNIFVLRRILENSGVIITVAENGRQAVEALQKTIGFDLVFMEIMMPVMDGYDAMRRIRQNLQLQQLPIIAITAHAIEAERNRCIQAGASDYISKPLSAQKIKEVLHNWIVTDAPLL
ncbi:ATP-binding protein [Kurthia sibirica]|nr:ATP-binding protein [Kurthia sibirica]GEK33705.1 histidine kinase [Kurthia sibirica]